MQAPGEDGARSATLCATAIGGGALWRQPSIQSTNRKYSPPIMVRQSQIFPGGLTYLKESDTIIHTHYWSKAFLTARYFSPWRHPLAAPCGPHSGPRSRPLWVPTGPLLGATRAHLRNLRSASGQGGSDSGWTLHNPKGRKAGSWPRHPITSSDVIGMLCSPGEWRCSGGVQRQLGPLYPARGPSAAPYMRPTPPPGGIMPTGGVGVVCVAAWDLLA